MGPFVFAQCRAGHRFGNGAYFLDALMERGREDRRAVEWERRGSKKQSKPTKEDTWES